MKNPLISVIVIDYKRDNPFLRECLEAIGKQSNQNFEIILESDHPLKLKYPKLKVVDYSASYRSPAFKRDHAGQMALGEILAFIDDDAYPDKDWLKNMVKSFADANVIGVGGPGITPPKADWREAASGWMSASPLGAGPFTYRFIPTKKQFVDDYPSMNLAVRRTDFLAVGGFDSHYWPGEDTKLCLDLVSKLNKKIIYDPKVIVYHHRRPLWIPHLRQNGNFGLHRGFFARILPQTSLRPVYIGPPFMLLGLSFLLLTLLFPILTTRYLILDTIARIGWPLFMAYLLAVAANSVWIYRRSHSLLQGLLSIPAVFITHLWYGLRFLQGFFVARKLSR